MTMSNDRYERIRQALAMRPTPGPWEAINGTDVFTPLGARNAAGVEAAADDGWYIADCDTGPSFTEDGREKIPRVEKQANAALIAACDPGTIRALLDERDALAAENAMLRQALEGMTLRDAMAMSVRLPDEYSAKWGEALIGEQHPSEVEPVSVHIDWWMRVEAVYRYRMADAMLKAREASNEQ